jgi:hypothetical protein
MALVRRAPIWLIVVATAVLTAALTLGLDRGITALQPVPTPTPQPTAQAVPTVVVVIDAPQPTPQPSLVPVDQAAALLQRLQGQAAQQQGGLFVMKAALQVSVALESLSQNNEDRASRELVAAQVALDQALALVPENLKPPIEQERYELSRIRADLVVDPRNLDEDLRNMRNRLLELVPAPS